MRVAVAGVKNFSKVLISGVDKRDRMKYDKYPSFVEKVRVKRKKKRKLFKIKKKGRG